jgi:hypothetical protein
MVADSKHASKDHRIEVQATMRIAASVLAALLLSFATCAQAAEKGLIIRAGDLLAQPFIDAAKSAPVTANQPVTILERRGGWASIEINGQKGWVRLLNLRLDAGPARPAASSGNPLAGLRTGSSGRTVTTGVKGMDEEDIRNSTPDYGELAELDGLGVAAADARTNAQRSKLAENTVEYLDKGRKK